MKERATDGEKEPQTEAMRETDTEKSIILTAGNSTLSTHFKRIKNYSAFSHSVRVRESRLLFPVLWYMLEYVREVAQLSI